MSNDFSPIITKRSVEAGSSSSPAIFPIVESICKRRGFDPKKVCGKLRHRPYVRERRAVAQELRDMKFTLPEIGRMLGGRDHSTIINLLGRKAKYCRSCSPDIYLFW